MCNRLFIQREALIKLIVTFSCILGMVSGLHAALPTVRVVATTQVPGISTIDVLGITLNADGLTAFRSSGGREWSEADGLRQIVADQGTLAPGTSAYVGSSFDYPPVINAQGDIAFYGALQNGDATAFNNRGIWVGRSGALNLAARTGNQATGLAPGVNFSSFAAINAGSWTLVNLNNQGQVAFGAYVVGPGIDLNRSHGIWAGTPGSLQLVAMENQPAPNGIGTYIRMGDPVINNVGRVAFRCTIAPSTGDP
jgi:hypothetical protein